MSAEQRASLVLLLAIITTTGCGSRYSIWSGGQASRDPDLPTPSYLAQQSAEGGSFAQEEKPSPTEVIASTISNKVRQVSDIISIDSDEHQVGDPTSLSSGSTEVNADVYLAAARISQSQNRWDNAANQYELALEVDPHHRNGLIGYARLLDQRGEVAEAELIYRRAVDAHGEDALVYNDLGMFYARRELYEESLAALVVAARIAPTKKLYRNNLATVLVQINRSSEAYAHLATVHSEAIAHFNLGILLQKNGQPEMARAQFDAALQLDPSMRQAGIPLSARPPSEAVDLVEHKVEDPTEVVTVDSIEITATPESLVILSPIAPLDTAALESTDSSIQYPMLRQNDSLSLRRAPVPSANLRDSQQEKENVFVLQPSSNEEIQRASYTDSDFYIP